MVPPATRGGGMEAAGGGADPRQTARGVALACLASPTTVVALGVWAWNDHVGKAAFPGPVSGKLSDVVGLIAFPVLLALLLAPAARRLGVAGVGRVAVAITGLAFTAVQVHPPTAEAAAAVLTALAGPSRMHADPWDLLALPALAVPWRLWARAATATARTPAGRRERVAAVLLLPALVLTTTATSCADPDRIRSLAVDGGVLVAGTGWSEWWESRDGGRSWQRPDGGGSMPDALEAERPSPVVACAPDDQRRCYRGGSEPVVEASDDGGATWAPAWQLPPARRPFVERAHARQLCADPEVDLAVSDLLVVPDGDAHRVVAAVGHDGVVVRGPDGAWERVEVGRARPAPLAAPFALIEVELLLAGLTAWAVVIGRARREARAAIPGWGERRGARRLILLGGVFAVLALLPAALPGVLFAAPPVALSAPVLLAGVVSLWVVMTAPGPGRRASQAAAGRALTAGALAAVAAGGPLVAWSAWWVPSYPVAILLALAGTAAVVTWRVAGPVPERVRPGDAAVSR